MPRKKQIVFLLFIFLLLNKIAYSEEKKNLKPRVSIKLTGGLGYVTIGDLNRCLGSLNEEFKPGEYQQGDSIKSRTGEIRKLDNFTPDWEAELRIDISPKFALGIGTSGYIHRKNESSIHISRQILEPLYNDLIFEDSISIKPEVKAWMPVKVGIYYGFLRTPRINFFLTGGIGCYSVSVSEYKRLEEIDFLGDLRCLWRYWEIRNKAGLSLYGGLELEYSLTKNLVLVLEVQGRYAKINNLKGTTQLGTNNNDIFYEGSGTLYYLKWSFETAWIKPHYDLEILKEPEDDTVDSMAFSDARKAILDLSGFSLRMGIKINLF